jgi:hypothetical protein
MQLASIDGSSLALSLVAYEFPEAPLDSFERDWLLVAVTAQCPKGSWSRQDACLLDGEAPMIAHWLRSAASGLTSPIQRDAENEGTPDLTFVEPALAFTLASSHSNLRHLRVHLTHGLAPPWLDVNEALATWQFFVELVMTDAELLTAADEWDKEFRGLQDRRSE